MSPLQPIPARVQPRADRLLITAAPLSPHSAHTLLSAAAGELMSGTRQPVAFIAGSGGGGAGGRLEPPSPLGDMDGLATGHLHTTKFPKSRSHFLPSTALGWRKRAEKSARVIPAGRTGRLGRRLQAAADSFWWRNIPDGKARNKTVVVDRRVLFSGFTFCVYST